jgi:hypothetical protein
VVEVSKPDSVDKNGIIQPDVVAAMLDAGLTALAQKAALFNATLPPVDAGADDSDAGASDADGGTDHLGLTGQGGSDNPWRVLLPNYRPGMRIGLKVNCLNQWVVTSPALVHAIVVSLRDKLGVDPGHIVVWDRRLDELNRHGKYSADDLAGAQLLGTQLKPGLAPDAGTPGTADEPGYGDMISPTIECRSPRLSRILTDRTDLTINCSVFKVHGQSGVTAAMKNIYGIIDIPASYHGSILHTGLPKLYALPAIRNSISLNICDALIAVANGNTDTEATDPPPRRILLAQDPVAMDSYALDLMNKVRASMAGGRGLPPIETSLTQWLDNAVAHGLGTRNYDLVPLAS